MTAGEEQRLAAAIDDSGPVRAADQLAAVRRRLLRQRDPGGGRRDLVADLAARVRGSEDPGLDEAG